MVKRIWRLLDQRERLRIAGIGPLLAASALVEAAGVAAVLPFLGLLSNPDGVGGVPVLGRWLAGLGSDSNETLRVAGVALAAVVVAANLLVILTNWWLNRYTADLTAAMSSRLLRHYLSQPYLVVLARDSSTLANRTIYQVSQLVGQGVRSLLEIAARSVVIVALIAVLVALDPRTALISFLCVAGAYGAVFLASRRYLARAGREAASAGAARLRVIYEALGGFKELRVAGRELFAHEQYLAPSRRAAAIHATTLTIAGVPRTALEAVAVAGIVTIATFLTTSEAASPSNVLPLLGAYAFAGLRILPAMQALFGGLASLRFTKAALDEIEADFGLRGAIEDVARSEVTECAFTDAIELRGVTFAYPGTVAPALNDVSLSIPRLGSVAIIGTTGSGKSTLADVLLGLLEPSEGGIFVDGRPVGQEQVRSYRRLFGYVPQTIFLMDDTIARNVAFGLRSADIDHAAVVRACQEAQVADFIESELPLGYETPVGERGVRLSGGQRQRLGIARALYHQPQVIVMDEATSALDVHTEDLVFRAVTHARRGRTIITIAHRLETAAKADWVVVMRHGSIVDQGPPSAVLERFRSEPEGTPPTDGIDRPEKEMGAP